MKLYLQIILLVLLVVALPAYGFPTVSDGTKGSDEQNSDSDKSADGEEDPTDNTKDTKADKESKTQKQENKDNKGKKIEQDKLEDEGPTGSNENKMPEKDEKKFGFRNGKSDVGTTKQSHGNPRSKVNAKWNNKGMKRNNKKPHGRFGTKLKENAFEGRWAPPIKNEYKHTGFVNNPGAGGPAGHRSKMIIKGETDRGMMSMPKHLIGRLTAAGRKYMHALQ